MASAVVSAIGSNEAAPRSWRRWILLLTLAAIVGAWFARGAILPEAGRALVSQDQIGPADIVVIGVATDGAGVLEAADLVHSGIASRVAVFDDPPNEIDAEFLRRGVPYEDEAERSIRELRSLGVSVVEIIPRAVAGTEEQGASLPEWCEQRGFHRIVIVCLPDHSRRLERIVRRTMKGRTTQVMVRVARHSSFHPDQWWRSRVGLRTEIIELQKLLLDFARHPFD